MKIMNHKENVFRFVNLFLPNVFKGIKRGLRESKGSRRSRRSREALGKKRVNLDICHVKTKLN